MEKVITLGIAATPLENDVGVVARMGILIANVCRKRSLQSADVDLEDCFEASLTNARERDEPLSSVGHLYIHHMFLKEHLSQRLVGIQVDCDDAQRCLVEWLPNSGAEVDAIGQIDLDTIDPHLKLNLSPDNLRVHAANGGRFNVLGKLDAQLTIHGRTQRGFEGVHQIQLGVWGAL